MSFPFYDFWLFFNKFNFLLVFFKLDLIFLLLNKRWILYTQFHTLKSKNLMLFLMINLFPFYIILMFFLAFKKLKFMCFFFLTFFNSFMLYINQLRELYTATNFNGYYLGLFLDYNVLAVWSDTMQRFYFFSLFKKLKKNLIFFNFVFC